MSFFSKLTAVQKEQAKNCKSEEELNDLLKSFGVLEDGQLGEVAGGGWDWEEDGTGSAHPGCPHPDWPVRFCQACSEYPTCPVGGDSRDDVKAENISSAFAEGRISGADFFA